MQKKSNLRANQNIFFELALRNDVTKIKYNFKSIWNYSTDLITLVLIGYWHQLGMNIIDILSYMENIKHDDKVILKVIINTQSLW